MVGGYPGRNLHVSQSVSHRGILEHVCESPHRVCRHVTGITDRSVADRVELRANRIFAERTAGPGYRPRRGAGSRESPTGSAKRSAPLSIQTYPPTPKWPPMTLAMRARSATSACRTLLLGSRAGGHRGTAGWVHASAIHVEYCPLRRSVEGELFSAASELGLGASCGARSPVARRVR